MRLEFERTIDDYLAFARVHMKRSRKYRWRRLRIALASGVVMGALEFHYAGAAIASAIAVVFACFIYAATPQLQLLGMRSAYKKNKKNFGPAELEVKADGIVGRQGDHELKTRWDSVGDVVTEGDQTFIYIDEAAAHIIPHRRVSSGNYVLFLQELARRIEAHTLAPLSADNMTQMVPAAPPAILHTQPVETTDITITRRV